MHGRRRPIQTSPVPRRVIAVVDELVARVALPRRIVVVLVSDSGVVEALRMRRCFPASGKKGCRVLASTTTRSHLSRWMWIR